MTIQTTTDIVRSLYSSRRYDMEDGTYRHESPLVGLIYRIAAACEGRGLTLSRWETGSRRNGWVRTITYAAHRGPRPARSTALDDADIAAWARLNGPEGKGTRCTAYQALSAMLADIENVPVVS